MSADWVVKRLDDVLKLEYGKPLPKEDRDDNGEYPAYGANGIKCRTNRFYRNKPSIIVGRKGSAGEVNLSADKFWPLDVTYFVDYDEEHYDRMFLYYCLLSLKLQSLAKGVKPGINRNDVYAIERAFPPLPEQKRIVAILDEAFAAISQAVANAEKNLANARELFESYLNNVFEKKGDEWEEKPLGQICENLDSKRIPITKAKRESGDIPYYGASGIVDYVADYIFNEELLLVSEDGANLLARTYPIAFSITGKTWVNNHAHVLRFENKETLQFVEYYFNSISLEPYVSGMAQPKLNQKALNSIPVPLPDLLEHKRVVKIFNALAKEIQHLETIYQQKLTALAELKQSILQKAFSGELTADASSIMEDTVA